MWSVVKTIAFSTIRSTICRHDIGTSTMALMTPVSGLV